MKIWSLFLLGILVSCQPATMSPQARLAGNNVRDSENSLGDELFNKTWYRDRAPGVVTAHTFGSDGSLSVRGFNSSNLDQPINDYDEDWNYQLNGSNLMTIDHDFYSEQYTYTIEEEAMRLCVPNGQCTDFYTLIEM